MYDISDACFLVYNCLLSLNTGLLILIYIVDNELNVSKNRANN